MSTTRTKSLFRSVALLGAMAAGTSAFGDFYDWQVDEKGYWSDEASWQTVAADFTDYRIGNHGPEIAFGSAIVEDDGNAVLIYNGEHTFTADEASFGLSKANAPLNITAPWWFTYDTTLKIASGAYKFASVNMTPDGGDPTVTDKTGDSGDYVWGGSGNLSIEGGSLTVGSVNIGDNCTLTLDGGAITLASLAGNGTLVIGAKGCTIDVGENDVTFTGALSGNGTVTKAGSGTLTFAGDTTGFNGGWNYAEGAGQVVVAEPVVAAYVGSTSYETVQAAFDAATANDEITVLVSATVTVTEPKTYKNVYLENDAVLSFNAPFTGNWVETVISGEEGQEPTSVWSYAITRNAAEYVYVPVGSGNHYIDELTKTGYFTLNDEATALVPGAGDTIVIAGDVTLRGVTRYVSIAATIRLDANLSLQTANGRTYIIETGDITGTGTLAFYNSIRMSAGSSGATYSCPVKLCADETYPTEFYIPSSGREITVAGALTGSGYLKCTRANAAYFSGCVFNCDASQFTGTIESVKSENSRNLITFFPGDFSGATIIVGDYDGSKNNRRFIDGQSNTAVYKFGSLSGYVHTAASNIKDSHPTIEIGALGKNDAITGDWIPNGNRNPTIRKVGKGTLDLTGIVNAHAYILNGGKLVLAATDELVPATEIAGATIALSTDAETGVKTYTFVHEVAYVGEDAETLYESAGEAAAAAFETADEAKVTLVADDNGDLVIPEGKTLTLEANGKVFSGKVSGAGTLRLETKIDKHTFGEWTGTVVIAWDESGTAEAQKSLVFDNYGVAGSKVVLDCETAYCYLKKKGENAQPSVAPAVYLNKSLSLQNGFAGEACMTTISQLGAAEDVTFTLRQSASYVTYFTIDALVDFKGAIVVPANNSLTIGSITTVEGAEGPYVKLVNSGTLAGLESVVVDGEVTPLVYATVEEVSGLYKAAATVTAGDITSTYLTVADAIAAAQEKGAVAVKVYDGSSAEFDGWTYDAETASYKATNVAQVGEVAYPSLADALAAAADGEIKTVELLKKTAESVAIPAGVTLAPAGFAVTGAISGEGVIVLEDASAAGFTFGEWTGTVVMNAAITGGANYDFNKYGVAGSRLVLAEGFAGYTKDSTSTTYVVAPTIVIPEGKTFDINNGTSTVETLVTFSGIAGEGEFKISFAPQGSYKPAYAINKVAGFSGSITLVNSSTLTIGAIEVAEAVFGTPVLKISKGSSAVVNTPATATVGEAEMPAVATTAGISLAAATISGTNYASVTDALIAASNAGITSVYVYDAAGAKTIADASEDWSFDEETSMLSYVGPVAQIGEEGEKYTTLAEALAEAENGDTVYLLGNNAEAVTIPAGITVDCGEHKFLGQVSGNGTLVIAKKVDTMIVVMNNDAWRGTVVVKASDAMASGLRVPYYGTRRSKIVLAADMAGYLTDSKGTGNGQYLGTLEIAEGVNVTINNGWPDSQGKKTFPLTKLTGAGNLAFGNSGWATQNKYLVYDITTLDGYTGTMTLNAGYVVKIGTVAVAAEPEDGVYVKVVGDGDVASRLNIDETTLTVAGEATETVLVYDAEKGGLVAPASGLDPASETPSVQVTAEDDDTAIAAAKKLIVAPAGVDREEYAECFKYKATAGEAGAYTVEVVDIAEATKAAVNVSALEVLNEVENAKIAVPAGLWYKITTMTEPGGKAVETLSDLSDGAGVSVEKPGDTQGFIKVELGATEGAVTGTVDSSSGSNEGTENL